MTGEFYQDTTLTCDDCGNQFTFTGGERKFFEQKGFTPPKRCKDCRTVKKMRKTLDHE